MTADKYLYNNAGQITERSGTVTSTGVSEAGQIVALSTDGLLDVSLMPVGIGPEVKIVVASEALTAGNLINIWNDTGTPKARKADATTVGKEANGFILASVESAANATVYTGGLNTAVIGLTGGVRYFLSTTPGGVTATAPSANGNLVQYVGVAVSATELSFEEGMTIVIAEAS